MASGLSVVVNGRWLAAECLVGDIEMDTVAAGGSEELSWSISGIKYPASLARGGLIVDGYFGATRVFKGRTLEPDPTQDTVVAEGLYKAGTDFPALDGSGNASTIPDVAIDQAITLGMPWKRLGSIRSTAVQMDVSQGPVTITELMDALTVASAVRWGVDVNGYVYANPDPTTPAYQMLPLDGGLGFSRDGYASSLLGRYFDGTNYLSATITDATAAAAHGSVVAVVDLTGWGTLTLAQAQTRLTNLLKLGRSTPSWTTNLEVSPGDLLTMGWQKVALERITAGQLVRIWGGTDVARAGLSRMYVDMLIGSTSLSGGTVTLEPMQKTVSSYQDFVTAALAKKSA